MSETKCEHPERLKGNKPGECSEEQQRICHGHASEKKESTEEQEHK